MFTGYALILFIDKVLFDSHGYFHDHEGGHHEHHVHGAGHVGHDHHQHHQVKDVEIDKRPLENLERKKSCSSDEEEDDLNVEPAFANVALKA